MLFYFYSQKVQLSSYLCGEGSKDQRMFISRVWIVLTVFAGVRTALGQIGKDEICNLRAFLLEQA